MISYIFPHFFAKSKLPIEKILTLLNVRILIKSVLNKDKKSLLPSDIFRKMLVSAAKGPIKIWDVNVDSKVISGLVKTKSNSKYLIWYSDEATRPLALIILKWLDMLKHLKLKIKTINWSLSVYIIRNC